jgi:hypothetical protein
MKKTKILGLFFLVLALIIPLTHAATEQEDIEIFGIELELILAMINAWIALFLFVITFIAYRRDGRKRLFFVSLAFLLFSIKSFLVSSEMFIPEIPWLDPTVIILEFIVIILFFYGVLKK